MNDDTIDSHVLELESRRLCQRYIDEVVLPFSLCPWAQPALQQGNVQIFVITDHFDSPASLHEAALKVRRVCSGAARPSVELILVLLPRCSYSRLEMDDLLREIRDQGESAFALAAFHPDAEQDTSSPERFIPYLRRSPMPMIQGVRTSVLDKIDPARGAGTSYFDPEGMDLTKLDEPPPEPLRLRVAKANLQTCQELGLDELERRFDSILEDRNASFARISGRKV